MLCLAVSAGLLTFWGYTRTLEDRRLGLLQIEARRKAIEIMSSTLNGNLMGAIMLQGLTDADIKREAQSRSATPDSRVMDSLSTLGRAFGAEGVFLVGADGFVGSSWDRVNKPSTGLDVRFRPYYKTAMTGKTSVYAAVSMARGDRSLYFAAPIRAQNTLVGGGIGAVVARTDLSQMDALLRGNFDQAMLLSPQGIVFAASQSDWVGKLAYAATPSQLAAIRELKQFGAMFERDNPQQVPLSVVPGVQPWNGERYALVLADVNWNDPAGHWTLVLMEDLGPTVPAGEVTLVALVVAALVLLLGELTYRLWRGRAAQQQAHQQLREFAAQQEASAAFRAELTQVAARLQRCERLPELAQALLVGARDLLGAMQGAVYVASRDAPTRLLLAGSAASSEPLPKSLALGQSLLGQCALDQRRLILATPPEGPWLLRSGLGRTPPGALVLSPLVLQDELVGAVELALQREPDTSSLAQLDEMLALLTNSLEILRRNSQAWQSLTHVGDTMGDKENWREMRA